jgi:transposase-like protein
MPRRYPVEVRRQVVELARAGTRVAQLAETFGMSEAVIYGWWERRSDLAPLRRFELAPPPSDWRLTV